MILPRGSEPPPGGDLEYATLDRRRRFSGTTGVYLALLAALGVAVAVSLRYDDQSVVQRFAPNVATEILSVVVTLAFVQRLLERQERARKLRAAVGALRKGRAALTELVQVWATVLRGCLDARRTEYPRTVEQLFASYYSEELACLDPQAIAGLERGMSWLSAVAGQIADTRKTLREIILTYAGSLDADYLEALDEVVDDPFARLVGDLANATYLTPDEWRLRMNRARGHQEAHFVRLVHAVRLHNRLARETSRFRSRHLAPRAESLTLQLGNDRDLAIDTEFGPGWWSASPPVGALRVRPAPAPGAG